MNVDRKCREDRRMKQLCRTVSRFKSAIIDARFLFFSCCRSCALALFPCRLRLRRLPRLRGRIRRIFSWNSTWASPAEQRPRRCLEHSPTLRERGRCFLLTMDTIWSSASLQQTQSTTQPRGRKFDQYSRSRISGTVTVPAGSPPVFGMVSVHDASGKKLGKCRLAVRMVPIASAEW
jgi:hypothetical protein